MVVDVTEMYDLLRESQENFGHNLHQHSKDLVVGVADLGDEL